MTPIVQVVLSHKAETYLLDEADLKLMRMGLEWSTAFKYESEVKRNQGH